MRLLYFFILFSTTYSLLGQQTLPGGQNYYNDGLKGILYEEEISFDFKLMTPRVFSFGVNIGKIKAYNHTRYYNFEFGSLRHPQEVRQNFDLQLISNNRVSRAFVYAKQNSVFALRASIGDKRYYSEKAKNKGLAVGVSYALGANLAFIKPYYLEIARFRDGLNIVSEEKYSVDNEEFFLDVFRSQTIIGGAPFAKGLNELSIMPGFSAKIAAHFDWGAFDEYVKALEAGIMLDAYLKDVPIMVESSYLPHIENSPVLLNLFINLQFGKRR